VAENQIDTGSGKGFFRNLLSFRAGLSHRPHWKRFSVTLCSFGEGNHRKTPLRSQFGNNTALPGAGFA
jgi:hypothetical protein